MAGPPNAWAVELRFWPDRIVIDRTQETPGAVEVDLQFSRVHPRVEAFDFLVGSDDVPISFVYGIGIEGFSNLGGPSYNEFGHYPHEVHLSGTGSDQAYHSQFLGTLTVDLTGLPDGDYSVTVDPARDNGQSNIFNGGSASPVSGRLSILIQSEPASLTSSQPRTCQTANGGSSSLWRVRNNFILLDFDAAVVPPGFGDIEINELLVGGGFGPNLALGQDFSFFAEEEGTRLRIRENGSVFRNRTWYAIRNIGNWPGVENFAVKVVAQLGDSNNDGRVSGIDYSYVIWGVPCTDCPDDRRDMDGDHLILARDVSMALSRVPSSSVMIPSGHSCP